MVNSSASKVENIIIDKLQVEGKDFKITREKKLDMITWYCAKRACLDCEGDIEFVSEAWGKVCDSCQEDIGQRAAYKCKGKCTFALCASCTECKSRHVMDRVKGKPPKYH